MAETEAVRQDWSLVRVPAALTLAVTLVRLAGELLHWSPRLFSPAVGGGLALVGISWLAPLFGIYFGVKLARAGQGPTRVGVGLGLVLLAIALLPVVGYAATRLGVPPQGRRMLLLIAAASVPAAWIAKRAWPELGRTLLVYAFAARIPVAVLMLFAILGNWGTHYDVAPPSLPAMGPWAKWLWIGVLLQMTFWIAYTLATGALFGIVAGALARRGKPTTA
jgi:hypothetical protein